MCHPSSGGGGGSAWLTWVSQRRRAAAGSHRAIQRRVCCSRVLRRLRETGYSPRRPIQYEDGGGRARYGGYAILRCGMAQSCTYSADRRSVPGVAVPYWGGGGFREG